MRVCGSEFKVNYEFRFRLGDCEFDLFRTLITTFRVDRTFPSAVESQNAMLMTATWGRLFAIFRGPMAISVLCVGSSASSSCYLRKATNLYRVFESTVQSKKRQDNLFVGVGCALAFELAQTFREPSASLPRNRTVSLRNDNCP